MRLCTITKKLLYLNTNLANLSESWHCYIDGMLKTANVKVPDQDSLS
jgi:hypothetical protein